MAWMTFDLDGATHVGRVDGDQIAQAAPVTTAADIVAAVGRADLPALRAPVPLADVRPLAPVPVPPSIRDFVGFEEHLTNGGGGKPPHETWYDLPVFYFSNPAAVFGTGTDIAVSPGSRAFDYELEVAAVIGKGGTNIPLEEAADHICGFTIMCDFSARDLQAKEAVLNLGPSKGKDGATSFGPVLATVADLEPYRSDKGFHLEMRASVNGREYSHGFLDDMYWSFAQLVTYASRGTRLVPGDVLGSGTVGTGCILEHRMLGKKDDFAWLRPGDVLELEVSGLGTLTHRISPAVDAPPLWADGTGPRSRPQTA
jgi:2-keto-4-pentenoate hydratase/2-oxohepta-3-ene-1,7-dioic acid hydratase in catechol pathway